MENNDCAESEINWSSQGRTAPSISSQTRFHLELQSRRIVYSPRIPRSSPQAGLLISILEQRVRRPRSYFNSYAIGEEMGGVERSFNHHSASASHSDVNYCKKCILIDSGMFLRSFVAVEFLSRNKAVWAFEETVFTRKRSTSSTLWSWTEKKAATKRRRREGKESSSHLFSFREARI